ncbi:MAG: hypothetical protein JXB85_04710 [Anaerolineales bacterium]|nr:hypothetical protein [Anaerolineales bacterium]
MPRYDFTCPICGQTFEKQLSFAENSAQVRCPSGHANVRRVYATPAVVFKGPGWYSTDHRTGGTKAESSPGD